MQKTITLDFYKVETEKGETTLEDALTAISASENNKSRNVELPVGVFRLNRCTSRDTRLEGEMIRIDMDDLPIKAKLSGETTELPFDEDEGVARSTAFLFDPTKSILVLQRNKTGTSAGTFESYFNNCSLAQVHISLYPSLNRDALKRLAKLPDISKLEFTIAPPGDVGFLDDSNVAVHETIKIARYFQSPSVTISVSRGHSKSFPSGDRIRSVVRKLFGSSGGAVTKLKVTGPGGNEVINFLLDKIQEPATVKYDDNRRVIPYQPRRNALRVALDKWYKEL